METEQFGFTYGGMDMSIHSHIQTKQQLNKKSAMSLREIREGYLGGYAGRKGEGEIIYYDFKNKRIDKNFKYISMFSRKFESFFLLFSSVSSPS